ncbi:hypothetical protein PR202_gb12256 [Eleusine coracana subsp. coracana]|uniref:DUF4220 domain-containing protein n=1 Tax=Eleusine coracana subsp. coracana TaxID=191504 RepID=A0AAV5ENW4_ELECO|nr:hypothetical protein QOZ80_7BG0586660 [Eleusine coracana subsp. coracana]GJN24512.1 hypothetical protein PR202_gb12256 [Eleusine coracana subsp. coracana]
MAGAAHQAAVHAWREYGIQVLVLLSFTLQVILLIFAEFRRRVDSGVLRFFVWSAYQLAESIAIYVLGHMSVTGGIRSPEHDLVAFWAPFLLMHLGGQDNITAYAMEDNKLWLRHLQTLAVQVAAAAYVLYASSIFSRSHHSLLLQLATILMFLVGIVKSGERVWALRCASSSTASDNTYYRNFARRSGDRICYIQPKTSRASRWKAEDIIFLGHEMLDIPKELLKGWPVPYRFRFIKLVDDRGQKLRILHLDGEEAYKVAEVQVSLMHDVFYTKAESQCGVIRLVSSLATAIALLLLLLLLLGVDHRHNNSNDGCYKRVDVAITCVLSVGAGVLEVVSLLRCFLSSFNWHRYERGVVQQERGLLVRVLVSLRRLFGAADRRIMHNWSRSMGQHNFLQVSFRNKVSRSSKIARWLGVENMWNTLACSWSIPVSPFVKQMILKQVLESCSDDIDETSPDHILNSRGRAVLKRKSQQLYDRLQWSVDPDELSLEETILVWHMATDIYLRWYKVLVVASRRRSELDDLAKAVEALSNYMFFILTARPYMLPPSSSSHYAYVKMCNHLTYLEKYTSVEDMAYLLLHYGNLIKNNREIPHKKWDTALRRGSVLAAKLIDELCGQDLLPSADMLELIGKVWVEMLCYVGSRCSGYSHAKQLSNGGELITVVAFVIEFLKSGLLKASGSTPIAKAV